VLDVVGLTGRDREPVSQFSLGMKQRLGIAAALLPDPRLLVLDEPTNGLDPAGIVEVRELLRTLAAERGATVFMSSHILAEVAQLADRIGIVHDGRLIEELDRAELAAQARPYVVLRVSDPDRAAALLADAGFTQVEQAPDGDGLRLPGVPEARTPEIARLVVGAGLDLIALAPMHEDLEAHFLRLTGGAA
jgi:ABC-type multidrug transport system ATPase subunit